jgi:hypothetical protein
MDPPGYRYRRSTALVCHFCTYEWDVERWATCAKYRYLTYLNSVCDSFESRGVRECPLPTPEEVRRLDGPWMKYPMRE